VGQEKNFNLYGAVGQRTLLSMNDFIIGMILAYRFSPNLKMSRAEQLFLSLWEFCKLLLNRLKF
jgi:hypothetical protein